ncbi:hypothetical protein [Agromyces sp. GXS1127]|uniref:hypothetical protein n=1 Tax=Agromyces sp. GXS1127 TaxID=3424181 RepID=UPI003D31C6A1
MSDRPPAPPEDPGPPDGPTEPPAGSAAAPPAAPSRGRSGSIWLGIVIAVVAAALVWVVPFAGVADSAQLTVFLSLLLGVPVALLVAGIVLAVIPRTRRTGGGLLIGLGAAVLITGGVCTAMLASWNVSA